MNQQLGFSYAILNDSYATGNGTLCIGAFVLIPFALKYGRRPVYLISTAAQLAISNLVCKVGDCGRYYALSMHSVASLERWLKLLFR